MVTWSRIDRNGTEHLVKQFDTFDQAARYFRTLKDPEEIDPERVCGTCSLWDGTYCTKELNNLDYSLVTEEMYREQDDTCDDWSEMQ